MVISIPHSLRRAVCLSVRQSINVWGTVVLLRHFCVKSLSSVLLIKLSLNPWSMSEQFPKENPPPPWKLPLFWLDNPWNYIKKTNYLTKNPFDVVISGSRALMVFELDIYPNTSEYIYIYTNAYRCALRLFDWMRVFKRLIFFLLTVYSGNWINLKHTLIHNTQLDHIKLSWDQLIMCSKRSGSTLHIGN